MISKEGNQDSTIFKISGENHVLSCAFWNGGYQENAKSVVNHTVAPAFAGDSAGYHQYIIEKVIEPNLLPERSVVMLTSVPQRNMARGFCKDYAPMQCWVTAGTGNAVSVGEPAGWCEKQEFGTVNILVAVDAAMTSSALANLFMLAAEAKTKVFHALGIMSANSEEWATGTGTDCITVVARKPTTKDTFQFAGSHTKLGEHVGRLVAKTLKDAILKHWEHKIIHHL